MLLSCVDSVIKERSSNKSSSQTNVAGAFYNDLALKTAV